MLVCVFYYNKKKRSGKPTNHCLCCQHVVFNKSKPSFDKNAERTTYARHQTQATGFVRVKTKLKPHCSYMSPVLFAIDTLQMRKMGFREITRCASVRVSINLEV